jgi:serine/threonine protein phosphatase PrpC
MKWWNKYVKDHGVELSGACVTLLLLDQTNGRYWTANTGDSRVVGYQSTVNGIKQVISTRDHDSKIESENMRITRFGGYRKGNYFYHEKPTFKKFMGFEGYQTLNMTRSFGDCDCGPHYLFISDPDVNAYTIESDMVFVVACDGLWDELTLNGMEAKRLRYVEKANTKCGKNKHPSNTK